MGCGRSGAVAHLARSPAGSVVRHSRSARWLGFGRGARLQADKIKEPDRRHGCSLAMPLLQDSRPSETPPPAFCARHAPHASGVASLMVSKPRSGSKVSRPPLPKHSFRLCLLKLLAFPLLESRLVAIRSRVFGPVAPETSSGAIVAGRGGSPLGSVRVLERSGPQQFPG
jgi:hypothetical protein